MDSPSSASQAKLLGLLQNFVSTPTRDNDSFSYPQNNPSTPRLGFRLFSPTHTIETSIMCSPTLHIRPQKLNSIIFLHGTTLATATNISASLGIITDFQPEPTPSRLPTLNHHPRRPRRVCGLATSSSPSRIPPKVSCRSTGRTLDVLAHN